MKSIIQEASSIEKAIKQGIEKAGNPRDFAVKVLEYPEKNFFGITTKPAKVAIYCEERVGRSHREPHTLPPTVEEHRKVRQESPRASSRTPASDSYARKQSSPHRHESRADHTFEKRTEQSEHSHKPERVERTERASLATTLSRRETRQEEPIQPRWSDELTRNSEQWLTNVLKYMNTPVPFTVHVEHTCLHITLDRPLFDDSNKERKVLSSLSLLLIETNKHTFKTNLRGHRVLLSHRTV